MNECRFKGRCISDAAEMRSGNIRVTIADVIGKKRDQYGNETDEWEDQLITLFIRDAGNLKNLLKGTTVEATGKLRLGVYNGKVDARLSCSGQNVAVIQKYDHGNAPKARKDEEEVIPF